MDLKDSSNVEGQLANVRREVNESIKELRRVIRALRPIYLDDLGLVPSLEMLAKDTENDHELEVIISVMGEVRRIESNAELALYRIVQEALSNSIRHAQAKTITLRMQFEADRLWVKFYDDGVGFNPPKRPRDLGAKGHFGLMGMYERADLIGARMELNSSPGSGTEFQIEIPRVRDKV